MADERRIPYIIELGIKEDSLRKQMSGWNWEEIIGIKDFGKHFKKPAEEASDAIENALSDTTIDWSKALQTDTFKREVTKIVQHANAELRAGLLSKEDAKHVTEFITEIGNAWKEIGTTMDTKEFARSMAAFAKSVEPLIGKIDQLVGAFSAALNNTSFADFIKESKETTSVVLELDKILQNLGQDTSGLNKYNKSLNDYKKIIKDITGKEYVLNYDIDTEKIDASLKDINEDIDYTRTKISDIHAELSKSPNDTKLQELLKKEQTDLANLLLQLYEVEQEYTKLAKSPKSSVKGKSFYKALVNEIKTILREFKSDAKQITEGLSRINLDLTLPEYQDFIPKINAFVDKLNTKSDSFKKITLKSEVVGKAQKSTDTALNNLDKSFDDKLPTIEEKVMAWRKKVIDALTLKSENLKFTYKWNESVTVGANALFDAMQDYFDARQIQVHIDKDNFIKQIKSAVESSDFNLNIGSGSADTNAILQALQQILSQGGVNVASSQGVVSENIERSVEQSTANIVKTEESVVKHLNESTLHIDDVISALKNLADEAYDVVETELPDGTKTTQREYKSKAAKKAVEALSRQGANGEELWIDFDSIKSGKASKNQIIQMIQNALMTKDSTGQAQGRAFADMLKVLITDNNYSTEKGPGGAIYKLGEAIETLFNRLDIKTESVDERVINQKRMSLWDRAIQPAQALAALQKVRHYRWDKEGNPTGYFNLDNMRVADIDEAIKQAELAGEDTESLKKFREARIKLGDSKNEAEMQEFNKAAFEFYQTSKKLYRNLSEKFGQLEADVYVDGRKDPIHVNSARKAAAVRGQVAKIVPYSAWGENYWTDKQLFAKKEYESDIRYQKFSVREFKPQDTSVQTNKTEGVIKRDVQTKLAENEAALQENEAKLQELEAKIIEQKTIVEQAKQTPAITTSREPVDQMEVQRALALKYSKTNLLEPLLRELGIYNPISKTTVTENDITEGFVESLRDATRLKDQEKKIKGELAGYEGWSGLFARFISDGERRLAQIQDKTRYQDIELAYPEVIPQVAELNDIIHERRRLEQDLNFVNTHTVEQIEKQLDFDQRNRQMYERYQEDPDSVKREVEKQVRNIKGVSAADIDRLVKSRLEQIRNLNTSFLSERERTTYEDFVQNPNETRASLERALASAKEQEATQKAAIIEWAKAEQAKLPDDKQEIEKVVKPVISQFKQQIEGLYTEATKMAEQLANPELSDDKRNALVWNLQHALSLIEEVDTEYSSVIKKLNGDKDLLSKAKRKQVNKLMDTYVTGQPSVADTHRKTLRDATEGLQRTELIYQQAQAENERLKADQERIKKQKEFQELKEQEQKLANELASLEEQGAGARKINNKKKALEGVRSKLAEIKTGVNDVNNTVDQGKSLTPYDKKLYGLNEALVYNSDLSKVYQQRDAISDELERIQAKRDKINETKAIENTSEFTQYKRHLQREYEKVLFQNLAEKYKDYNPDTMTEEMYQQYNKDYTDARKASDDYFNNLGIKDNQVILKDSGAVIAENIKEILISRIEGIANEATWMQQLNETEDTINKLREQRKRAMEYGGVTWDDMKNQDLVRKQIPLQNEITQLTAKKESAEEELRALKEDEASKKVIEAKQKEIQGLDEQINARQKAIDEMDAQKVRRKEEQAAKREAYSGKTKQDKGAQSGKTEQDKGEPTGAVDNLGNSTNAEETPIQQILSEILELLRSGNYKTPTGANSKQANSSSGKSTTNLPPITSEATKQYATLKAKLSDINILGSSDWAKYKQKYDELINYIASKKEKLDAGKSLLPQELKKMDRLSNEVLALGQNIKTVIPEFDKLQNKVKRYQTAVADATADQYLLGDEKELTAFNAAQANLTEMIKKAEEGKISFEQLGKAYRDAANAGAQVNKKINENKRLYSGTNELRAVERQRDKIFGAGGIDLQYAKDAKIKAVREYDLAYKMLQRSYKKYADEHKLNDPEIQKKLRRQAAGVQKLGRQLLSAAQEAEKLKALWMDSGEFYNTKGQLIQLGGEKTLNPEQVKSLEASVRAYAQELYGADLQNIKYNHTTKTLTGTIRENNRVVHDVAIQYNKTAQSLYAYEKAERESLSGLPAFMRGLKEKTKAITQYIMSMTSIYRVIGEVRKGIQYIKEIDLALTELKKVTDETEETYRKFLDTASKTAAKVGSTIKEVVSSTADFARLGYSLEEAAVFAESAQILMNVSEFTDVSRATDTLISAVQAFGYTAETSMEVVDLLNMIGKIIAYR